jgi:hypothetical protein
MPTFEPMGMTKKFFRVAFFFFLFFQPQLFGQKSRGKQEIAWAPPVVQEMPDGQKISYLYFEGAKYPGGPENPLPVYFFKEKLNGGHPGRISAVLMNTTTMNLSADEENTVRNYGSKVLQQFPADFSVEVQVAEIKKEYYALIKINPLRAQNKNSRFEKLTSFDLKLEFPDGQKPLARYNSMASQWASNSVLATGNWYKIGVTNSGIYRLGYTQFLNMGYDMSALNPGDIRIYGNGGGQLPYANSAPRRDDLTENAIFVFDGGNPGKFDSTDYVLFYGSSPHTWRYDTTFACTRFVHNTHKYSDTTYYFVTTDLGPGKRISSRNSNPGAPTHQVFSFDDHQFYENDAVNLIKSGREWFGEYFDVVNSYTVPFQFPNIDISAPVKVYVSMMGRSHLSPSNYNVVSGSMNFSVSCGGTDVNYYAAIYAQPGYGCGSFTPSSSNIGITITKTTPSPAVGWLNYIEVVARRQLVFSGNTPLIFRDAASLGTGNLAQYNVTVPGSSAIFWDVTNSINPVNQLYALNGNTAEFRVPSDSLRTFIAFSGSNFPAPKLFYRVGNQNLHGLPQTDYIIVSHPSFLTEAAQLGEFHLNQDNLSYVVVTPGQIYNEFSSGSQDVSAIRDFIRMFYERATGPNDLPKYVLLFGDGSYDNKYRVLNNTNFIPTYHSVNSNDPIRSYVSDDFFVQLGPSEGNWNPGDPDKPDAGIGRLPVKNASDAKAVVNKILRYYSTPGTVEEGNSPICGNSSTCNSFGDWRNILCFVADDEDFSIHLNQTEQITTFITNNYRNYNLDKIYLDAYPQVSTPGGNRYPEVVNAINRRIERGCLIFNYIGHGGEVGLAHERIIEVSQINGWTNICNLPLFFTATCEFTRWDDPGRVSAGEYVLLNPKGGGIGLFTTVRLVFSGPNYVLNRNFYNFSLDTLPGGIYPKLGDLNMLTKSTLVPDDNHRNFTLICDPALTLAYPRHRIITKTINGNPVNMSQPDTIRALSRVTITGEVTDISGNKLTAFNGLVFPVVYDKKATLNTLGNDPQSLPIQMFQAQKSILYRGKVSVVNGDFSFSFVVPKDIAYQYGFGKLSYYGHNGTSDATGNFVSIVIGGSDTTAPVDITGPDVRLYLNDANFVSGGLTNENPEIFAVVKDSNGINTVGNGIGHDIVSILDGNNTNPIILNDYYVSDLNSYTSGTIRYPLSKLPSGHHQLSLKVWDVYNNSSVDVTDFVVEQSAVLALKHVLNYPNPFTTRTSFFFEHNKSCGELEVQIQIMTVSGKIIKTINTPVHSAGFRSEAIPWDGLDDFGDPLGKGVYFYRVKVRSPEGEKAEEFNKLVILK